ncbi:hypothetical protein SSS_05066 [Sarcoptes scabiei]|uniref:Uncharacterized protein n=1 Tax=Sarcoptes scabiei TaxID=52283 RepID=A0A834VG13_SARSC|nr:hypothetical protein SSS_05066 [Sarcoptes scabiei]
MHRSESPRRRKEKFETRFQRLKMLLRLQSICYDNLRPNQRSFSNPQLSPNTVTIDDFLNIRRLLFDCDSIESRNKIEQNQSSSFSTILKQNITSHGFIQLNDNDENVDDVADGISRTKPVPVPRRSRKKFPDSSEGNSIHTSVTSVSSLNESRISYESDTVRTDNHSDRSVPKNSVLMVDTIQLESSAIKIPTKMKKTKTSFRSFLKIDKIKSNSFLSLRIRSKKNRKSLQEFQCNCTVFSENCQTSYKPQRPTRDPPPPPILIFRPPALLPSSILNESDQNDTNNELYNDAINRFQLDGIYYSVDGDENNINYKLDSQLDNRHQTIIDYEQVNDQQVDDQHREEHLYYDDGLYIYEELSSIDDDDYGTIYEEDDNDDYNEIIYDNAHFIEADKGDEKRFEEIKKLQNLVKTSGLDDEKKLVGAGIIDN